MFLDRVATERFEWMTPNHSDGPGKRPPKEPPPRDPNPKEPPPEKPPGQPPPKVPPDECRIKHNKRNIVLREG